MRNVLKKAFIYGRGQYRHLRDTFRRRTLEDEFIRWLRYANAGMLDPGNVWSMDYAIRHLPSGDPLLEIGSFAGLSANVMCYLLRRNQCGNALFTCDNWDVTGQRRTDRIPGSEVEFQAYADYVKSSYVRNVEFFSRENRPFTVAAGSTELFAKWDRGEQVVDIFGRAVQLGGPISFCYVDGLHSYQAVRSEFANIDRHLVPGGFILFDDSSDSSPFEVNRLMPEIIALGRYELIHQNPNYFFRKR